MDVPSSPLMVHCHSRLSVISFQQCFMEMPETEEFSALLTCIVRYYHLLSFLLISSFFPPFQNIFCTDFSFQKKYTPIQIRSLCICVVRILDTVATVLNSKCIVLLYVMLFIIGTIWYNRFKEFLHLI